MARKRYSDEDVLRLLREIELSLASGSDVATACRSAGVSDATYYTWRILLARNCIQMSARPGRIVTDDTSDNTRA